MINRKQAWDLLQKHVQSPNLIKHALAVEAGMVGYAQKLGEDQERFAVAGLLHDIDYESHPDEHPLKGVQILEEEGLDQEFVLAVKAHADFTNTPRESTLAKVLYAVDELASFIVACVLVRPDKSFEELKVKSVTKKLKDKAFAKGVDREIVKRGAEELGVEMAEHIQTLIDALRAHEQELNALGTSLVE